MAVYILIISLLEQYVTHNRYYNIHGIIFIARQQINADTRWAYIVILSVRLSVRLSRSDIVLKRLNIACFLEHAVAPSF